MNRKWKSSKNWWRHAEMDSSKNIEKKVRCPFFSASFHSPLPTNPLSIPTTEFNDNVKCLVYGFAIRAGKLKFLLVSIFLLFFQFTWLQHWTHSISWSPFSLSARSTFYDIQFILKCLTWLFGGVQRSAWHVECPLKRRQDEEEKEEKNSPYCIVRIIFKFLIGSGFDSTSNSSMTTDVTRLESSADAAFIVFSTLPWSVWAGWQMECDNQRINGRKI